MGMISKREVSLHPLTSWINLLLQKLKSAMSSGYDT